MNVSKTKMNYSKTKMKMRCEWLLTLKEKEKILVQGDNGIQSKFYVIDLAKGSVEELPYVLNHSLSTFTSVGSVIYAVGGVPSGVSKKIVYRTYAYYLDSALGWKEMPPYVPTADDYVRGCIIPTIPLCIPTAVSYAGYIYVFASYEQSPWALVLNTRTRKWATFLPPSDVGYFDLSTSHSAVADLANSRLLIHFKTISSLYAYYPSDKSWELLADSFTSTSKFVFVDGVFYVYIHKCRELVLAFDTLTNKWLQIEIESSSVLPDKMWNYKYDDMFYLGDGLMCLADSCCTQPPATDIFIAKFRFKRCNDRPGIIVITPLTVDTYTINTDCSLVNYYPF
ncbi:hypothetical protein KSS87_017835 [Heliosperma pusillum]|nr:hypothetical protein KSS87_017835 [Heliosperma pusillum]